MNKPQISRSTEEESKYIRHRLIEFNADQLPDHIKNRYEEINLNIKNADGKIAV